MVRQDKITYLVSSLDFMETDSTSDHDTPLECLIRTVLSQSTTDRNRDLAFDALKQHYGSWEYVAGDSAESIARVISSAGLSNRKAKYILECLRWAYQTFGCYSLDGLSDWTTDRIFQQLTAIPGVGVKTIAILACFALDRDVFPVDVHVHRVLTRFGVSPRSLKPDQTFHVVNPLVPFGRDRSFHLQLIRFGRNICRAVSPRCEVCDHEYHCDYFHAKNDWAVH